MEQIEWRGVVSNANGTFDCEINHPQFGWIPFTANPDDPEPHGRAIWEAINATHISNQPRSE